METNPFRYGRPIKDLQKFIGRESEMRQILARLHNSEVESSSVVGERRIGKTSLLAALKTRLVEDDQSVCAIELDGQLFSHDDAPQSFWERLLQQLSRALPHNVFRVQIEMLLKMGGLNAHSLSDLFEQLGRAGISIVLLLDEFENIAKNTNFGADFFYGLRALAMKHNLALITASYTELIELCHSDEVRASPFFNIFASVHLGPLTTPEAEQFFERYLAQSGTNFLRDEKDFIYSMAGNHPYYLQVASYFMFDAYQQGLSAEERQTYTRQRFTEEAEDTLEHMWRWSTDEEKIALTVLSLLNASASNEGTARFSKGKLQDHYTHAGPALKKLVRRGMVVEQRTDYAIFSMVLADWVRTELQSTLSDLQTYETWVKDPANQTLLARVTDSVKDKVKDQLLPKLKGAYWELIVSWLTNPATGQAAFELLRSQLR